MLCVAYPQSDIVVKADQELHLSKKANVIEAHGVILKKAGTDTSMLN